MTSVTLPLIDHSIGGENHLKNLTYIVRKPKGANAPPKATRLTRERFSIFIADRENGELPNLGVNGLNQQQSSNDELKYSYEKLDFPSSSSTHLFNQSSSQHQQDGGGKTNSLISISMLNIKGLSSSTPLEQDQINTVQNLFHSSVSSNSLVNGKFDVNDDIWNDFHDSQKLKNNLEVLLICKRMNLHFEVARNQNMPGMVVIPKFHCPRCYEAWKKDLQVPHDCDLPADPVRGAPIALDQRAQVFLKDQNISYIEINGSQTTMNKRFRKLNPSSIWKAASLANKRSDQLGDNLSSESKIQLRPKSQASAISVKNEEKAINKTISLADQFAGITEINIKNGEKNDGGEGVRKYGGLTNSQARVFINESLLNAKTSNSKQQINKQTCETKKKSSKEGLFKSSRKSKKRRKNNKKGSHHEEGNVAATSDNSLTDVITTNTTGDEQQQSNGSNFFTSTRKQNDSRRESVVQNSITLTINPEDTASEIFSKFKQRKQPLKAKHHNDDEKKPNTQQSVSSVTSGHVTSICQGNVQESMGHLRRASIQSRSDQQYVMQGAGNNLKTRTDGRRRSLKTKVDSNNPYGLGFTQSSSVQSGQQMKGDEDGEENFENDEEDARLLVRMRHNGNNSFINSSSHNRRSSIGSRTKVNVNPKHTKEGRPDYELPPVEVSKKSKVAPGSAEILRALNSAGSANSMIGGDSKLSSRSHSRCLDVNFSTDLYDSNGNLTTPGYGYHDSNKNKTTKSGQAFNQVKKRNIFFASRFLVSRNNEEDCKEVTMETDRTMLTPSPKLGPKFPQYDLMALRMSGKMSGTTFSYYKYPAQYKKHYEHVKNQAQNPSRKKDKSPRKKK